MLASTVITILLVILLIFFIEAVTSLGRAYILSRRAPALDPRDISEMPFEMPAPVLQTVSALSTLNFRPVGAASIEPPYDRPQVWYYADPAGTTVAGIFDIRGTGYMTMFTWLGGDAATVVTVNPHRGAMINDPDFYCRTVSTTVDRAYQMHCVQVDEFASRHGAPLKLDNMADILRLDRVYNTRFAARRLRPDMIRAGARAATALVIAVVVVLTRIS